MRYPAAIWRPTSKHGYPSGDVHLNEGLVAHSMEGSLAAAFAELDNPARMASWHFSVAKSGDVYQHVDIDNISWASGSQNANKRFWGIEHEGVAGEPLTPAQTAATTALMKWLLALKNLPAVRNSTLFEHREMTAFGSAPTACPSGRIPWDVIIAGIELEDDMKLIQITGTATWTLGELGKRQLSTTAEVNAYVKAGYTILEVTQAEADAIPDVALSHYKGG